MSLLRVHPWRAFDNLQDEINELFEQNRQQPSDNRELAYGSWQPTVDIKEDKDKFLLRADVPGVDPKDIEVSMENGVLTIEGKRDDKHEEKDDNYVRIERISGRFYRQFNLPQSADQDNISARSNQGVLEINIPKAQQKDAKKIEVKDS